MQPGGQQYHSLAEMRGLYGIEPHENPLERVLKKVRSKVRPWSLVYYSQKLVQTKQFFTSKTAVLSYH